jgi:hypothetical protein
MCLSLLLYRDNIAVKQKGVSREFEILMVLSTIQAQMQQQSAQFFVSYLIN